VDYGLQGARQARQQEELPIDPGVGTREDTDALWEGYEEPLHAGFPCTDDGL